MRRASSTLAIPPPYASGMKHSLATSSIFENEGPRPSRVAVMSRRTSSSTSLSLKILIALIGSPTYFGSLNLVVLTRPAPRSSRHGMTRVFSISAALREVAKEVHAEAVALLGVELHAPDIAMAKAAVELAAVRCRQEHVFAA